MIDVFTWLGWFIYKFKIKTLTVHRRANCQGKKESYKFDIWPELDFEFWFQSGLDFKLNPDSTGLLNNKFVKIGSLTGNNPDKIDPFGLAGQINLSG